jgi:hypothetical protein
VEEATPTLLKEAFEVEAFQCLRLCPISRQFLKKVSMSMIVGAVEDRFMEFLGLRVSTRKLDRLSQIRLLCRVKALHALTAAVQP